MVEYFLISNMYPTTKFPGYGIFVKNITEALKCYGINNKLNALILGKSKGRINKLLKYFSFYLQILINFWKKYDYIYIHFPNQAIPILYPLLKLRKRKLIINLHGEDLMYGDRGLGNKMGKLMEKTCREFATAIVVPSTYFRDIVVERNLLSPERIIVSASGGINEHIFVPPKKKELDHRVLKLGYVGRLEKDKGILEYLEVCRCLDSESFGFIGVIIGYGNLYEYTKRYIEDKNLGKKITLIQGVPQTELGDYYRDMDLLLFNSSRVSESLGLTGIEAMACGVPVIGSDIGGIATYVIPGYNGWLTPVNDINAIVKAVKDFSIMSSQDKEKMISNCIRTGQNYYASNVSRALAAQLERIVSYNGVYEK